MRSFPPTTIFSIVTYLHLCADQCWTKMDLAAINNFRNYTLTIPAVCRSPN
jgi:hypothetical protein